MKTFVLSWCGGFFLAMACVNTIAAILTRSGASGAYAALMLVMVLNVLPGSTGINGSLLHAVLIAAYMVLVVAFSFTLLRVKPSAPVPRTILVLAAATVLLVFAEDLMRDFWVAHFFFIDQLALDALLVALVVLGVRSLKTEGRPIAGTYLAGLAGPIAGIVLTDLAENNVLPHSVGLLLAFYLGLVWESLFFAVAVGFRNRGVQFERNRFEKLAYLDALTGVANRRTFDENLERMWDVSLRARVPVAVAMIDIDYFKRLNDTRGHQVGDECLRRVAAICSSVLRRAGDCFARYGGEEFSAILVNVDLEHARELAESMRRAVERDGGMTVSIGVASRIPRVEDRAEFLVADADQALYTAKNSGRNCVCVAACVPDAPAVSTPGDPGIVQPMGRRSGIS